MASSKPHVCPWWLIHTFDNPLRRLVQKPERILRDIVRPGDACLDLGCGIGYFTIPLAGLVGPSGSVTAVDLQPEMLVGLRRRAEKAGLLSRIRPHQADASGLPFEAAFDFALAFWMAHEVPDQGSLFHQIRTALKPGGRFLLVEPKFHVRQAAFEKTVGLAEKTGFTKVKPLDISFSRAVLLINRTGSPA